MDPITEADTDELLEELAAAAKLHEEILKRQAVLIERLRKELKGVHRDGTH